MNQNVQEKDNIFLSMTRKEADAVNKALQFYADMTTGRLEVIVNAIEHGVIPLKTRNEDGHLLATDDQLDYIDDLVFDLKNILGFSDHEKLSIGHQRVSNYGKRAYKIHKELSDKLVSVEKHIAQMRRIRIV